MNSVIIIGNLTRDPEVRYSTGTNQTAIGKFSVAVNDGYGEKKKTSFIPVTVFGRQAEMCQRYLHKGSKVAVKGRIQTGSYKDKEGRTVYTTDVIAEIVEFLRTEQVTEQVEAKAMPPQVPAGFTDIADEDIGF